MEKKYGFLSFIPIDKTDQVIEVDLEGERRIERGFFERDFRMIDLLEE